MQQSVCLHTPPAISRVELSIGPPRPSDTASTAERVEKGCPPWQQQSRFGGLGPSHGHGSGLSPAQRSWAQERCYIDRYSGTLEPFGNHLHRRSVIARCHRRGCKQVTGERQCVCDGCSWLRLASARMPQLGSKPPPRTAVWKSIPSANEPNQPSTRRPTGQSRITIVQQPRQ
jgi:hypothetical protein